MYFRIFDVTSRCGIVKEQEVDEFVIKKLLTRHDNYFKKHRIGKDCFITLRVHNPMVEKSEAKILLETLESVPRSYDTANLFYREDNIPPIFEVMLPMATNTEAINRVYYYYRDLVVGKQHRRCFENDITIKEWIGEFKPETIEVIPLFPAGPGGPGLLGVSQANGVWGKSTGDGLGSAGVFGEAIDGPGVAGVSQSSVGVDAKTQTGPAAIRAVHNGDLPRVESIADSDAAAVMEGNPVSPRKPRSPCS